MTGWLEQNLIAILQILIAILEIMALCGTVFVSLVYGEKIRDFINRPKLKLSLRTDINNKTGDNKTVKPLLDKNTRFELDTLADGTRVADTLAGGTRVVFESDSMWFHLNVRSEGTFVANNVEVFLSQLKSIKPHPSKNQNQSDQEGKYSPNSMHGPVKLRWQYDDRFTSPSIVNIRPDRVCDLCYVNQKHLRLPSYIRPNWLDDELKVEEGGKLKLELQACAENAKVQTLYVEIEFKGKFYADETEIVNGDNLIVKEITRETFDS